MACMDGWWDGWMEIFKKNGWRYELRGSFTTSSLYLATVLSHCPFGFRGSFIIPLLYVTSVCPMHNAHVCYFKQPWVPPRLVLAPPHVLAPLAGPPWPAVSPANVLSPLARGRISLPTYCPSDFRGRNFCIGWRDGFILTVILPLFLLSSRPYSYCPFGFSSPLFLLSVRRLHLSNFRAGFTNMRICLHSSFTIYNSWIWKHHLIYKS
jgi:hypothetical protein